MVEASLAKPPQLILVKQRAAGYQVGVEIMRARMLNQLGQIVAKNRLAAGEMQLHDAQLRGLGKNPLPIVGREFRARAMEIDGIGAVHASQRASISKLRN